MRGLREPLPIACRSSAAFAGQRDERRGREDARKAWAGSFRFPGEVADAEHVLVGFDGVPERPEFAALARELWAPLLSCERSGWS